MENQPVTLDQRPGTFDLGKIYEFKMLALLALRCVENSKVKHAWWASNVKDAYDFDDVVLYVEDQNNKRMLYLVQLKHKEKPKSIEDKAFLNTKYQGSNDFSLHKYQKSYFSITSESEKNDLITSIGEADQIYYVLYTNRSLAKNLIFLDVVEQEHKLLDSSETTGNIYKFNSNTQNFNEQFLSNLLLFTKQVHATKIDDLIKMELLRIAGPVKINVNDVSNKYLGFIDAWIKGVKNYKLESLTKKDVTLQLMLFFLEHYILTFPLSQPSRKEFSIWNKIVDESCITVVEASELTHEFLSSYLSVKFSDFCGLDDWEQDVHKDTFYENKPDLKSILMKIVGDTNLTVQKIYHALWSIKKLPLLVEAKTTDDFDNIQRVLRLSKCENYPVIVLSRVEIDEVRDCTFNLSNLNLNLKNSILRYRISFQGRPKACLKDLVDFKMYKLIKCADIIEIISNRFKIGATQTTTRFYIPRQISRVFFTAQELKKIKSKFLLRGVDSTLFEKMFKDKKAKENIIKLDDGLNLNQGSQDYHLLEYVSKNTFKLKHTHNKLETFDTSECWWLPQNETKELFDESVCVVNGHAGIGKTEFLNHIALKAPVNTWVINVNLNAHNDYYKTLKNGKKTVLQHLTYFYGTPNCSNKELEKKVFDLFLKHKNVLVLLDGFDEISMTYMEEVTSIATSLQQDGYKVWITTRPAFKGHLEKALNTMSRTLRSLPFKQQQKFLTQYYKHLATNKTQMLNVIGFVQNLLEAAAKNLNDSQFTGQPLQAKLLADAFEIEVKEVLNNKKIELEDKFDLVFLYERFIEEKIDIACRKFGDTQRDARILWEELQEFYALRIVFPQHLLDKLRVDEKLKDIKQKVSFVQREGLMATQPCDTNSDEKFHVNFVHRTFAEFLAAQWLYKNYQSVDVHNLLKCRFEDQSNFLFNVFDRYLAKDFDLHLSIINKKKNRALELIKIDPSSVGQTDRGGRTILHLISCYCVDNSGDEMMEIIDAIPKNSSTYNIKDDLLGYTALEYAFSVKAWGIANKLCGNSKHWQFSLNVDEKKQIFDYCDRWMCNDLFLVVYKYFARKELLMGIINPNTHIDEYCEYKINLMEYLGELKSKTIKDLVQNNDDVHFVAAFGDENELLQLILKGINVNETDTDMCTALHYATLHNRLTNASILLKNGTNKNSVNNNGETPLHIALKLKYFVLADYLIEENADVNLSDGSGMTALLYACKLGKREMVEKLLRKVKDISSSVFEVAFQNNRFEVIFILIEKCTNMDLVEYWKNTTFLYACEQGNYEIVQNMLPMFKHLNFQNSKGLSPLHLALRHQNFNIVQTLLLKSADVNVVDLSGDTPLFYACQFGTTEVLKKILRKVTNINSQNHNGQSALHKAIQANKVDIVNAMISEKVDPNLIDNLGNNSLLYACEFSEIHIVK